MNRIAVFAGTSACHQEQSRECVQRILESAAQLVQRPVVKACAPFLALGSVGPQEGNIAETERYCVALQGKIYNRDELSSPTEVGSDAVLLARLVSERGFDKAIESLNGDFAAACVDKKSSTLWLARDRMGARPLFFATTQLGFAAASSIGSLLQVGGVSRKANRGYVARFAGLHYRTFDNFPDESPFADVCQLPAAHIAEVRGGRLIGIRRYWNLEKVPMQAGREIDLVEKYRELLLDAVGRRVRAAESPAFTLSGGMDSSSVLACAVRALGRKQIAYSTVYSDPTFDETVEIRSMLESTVETWNSVEIDNPDVIGTVERMVRVHAEPVATATWLSHFLLCERASSQGIVSLFGGLGGDELNAGEYEYFLLFFADLVASDQISLVDHEIEAWVKHHDHPIYRKSRDVVNRRLTELVDLGQQGACKPDSDRLRRYRSTVAPSFFDLESFSPVMEAPFRSYLTNRTYQDLTRETTPCCLRAEDRHTSFFGMENIDPFLDHRLVEFMFGVPGTLKIRHGVTKYLLREAMKGILPDDTRTRVKKTGWNAPAHVWFSGSHLGGVRDLVRSRAFRERGIYDLCAVEKVLDEHVEIVEQGRVAENHMMFIWQLVNLESWIAQLGVEL